MYVSWCVTSKLFWFWFWLKVTNESFKINEPNLKIAWLPCAVRSEPLQVAKATLLEIPWRASDIVCEHRRHLRNCTDMQARIGLTWSHIMCWLKLLITFFFQVILFYVFICMLVISIEGLLKLQNICVIPSFRKIKFLTCKRTSNKQCLKWLCTMFS